MNTDKLKDAVLEDKTIFFYTEDYVISVTDCRNAMDSHAEQISILFSEWKDKWYSCSKGRYRHRGDFYKNDKKLYTTKELFHLFIKHLNEQK